MEGRDLESVKSAVGGILSHHTSYKDIMRDLYIFTCELFLIWQVIANGVVKHINPSVTVIGAVLLLCTYITYRIYKRSSQDLQKHAEIIMNEQHKIDRRNVVNFLNVIEKYKFGKDALLAMNISSTLYVVVFLIVTLIQLKFFTT